MLTKHPNLTIVIPALNEEESIGQTVQRCLDAVPEIQVRGGIGSVEIIVVSDGSTDRTAEIAQRLADEHDDVHLIIFEKNRGYGAAIKEGFRVGAGELVAFLDADGTCDPRFFGDLCAALQQQEAQVALGDRMGPGSQMPPVRRLGNRCFALLLGFLSGDAVTDTASGMRVLRREVLKDLYPLPDGLDFTPAISARAVMQRLQIIEVPMAYAERIGTSKLSAVRDGVRFLRAIFDAVLFYYPARLYMLGFTLCIGLLVLLAISPTEFYLRNGSLEEWMFYRFVTCQLLGAIAFTLLSSAVIVDDLFFLTQRRRRWRSFGSQVLNRLFAKRILLVFAALMFLGSIFLIWPGLMEYMQTRHVTLHWSRVIAAAFGFLLTIQSLAVASLRWIIRAWQRHLSAPTEPRPSPASFLVPGHNGNPSDSRKIDAPAVSVTH